MQSPSVYHRFLESVRRSPDNNALHCRGASHTYADLLKRVSTIRQRILEWSTSPLKRIGVVTGNDVDTYASVLAILSLGAAFVPLDARNPKPRNLAIVEDACLPVVLSSREIDLENVILTANSELSSPCFEEPPTQPDDPVYILYTSGSTGKPKGVLIHHKNLNAFMQVKLESGLYDFGPTDRILQTFELTFDLAMMPMFVSLSVGACCYVIQGDGISFPEIAGLLEDEDITAVLMVPSVLAYLEAYFDEIQLPSLKYSLFCGEALPDKLVDGWSKCVPNARIENLYGPTEATIYCTRYVWSATESPDEAVNGIVPIGKALPGVGLTVINPETRSSVLEGERGELCLMGAQVTSGYWNNPQQTERAFIPNDEIGKPMYRTGDECYVNAKGDYVFCARIDNQVKIDGHRIELGEIEHHARQHSTVQQALAVAAPTSGGTHRLLLFVVGHTNETPGLSEYLAAHLPSYMQPDEIINRPKFPLNANGKINRKVMLERAPYRIRPATEADASFVAYCILTAEASGTGVVSYERVFELSRAELVELLEEIAAEEIEGQELTWNNFMLIEFEGKPVGGCGHWVEADGCLPSGSIKAQIWSTVLGYERFKEASERLELVASLGIERKPGTIQIETCGILPEHRGRGLAALLFNTLIRQHKLEKPSLDLAQLQVIGGNRRSHLCARKAGFTMTGEKTSDAPEISELLPSSGRILMERALNE